MVERRLGPVVGLGTWQTFGEPAFFAAAFAAGELALRPVCG